MLTRILALVAVLLLAPSTLAHANARALSLESASLGIFAGNVDLCKEIPDLTHCCIKEKSTERSETSNRREEYLRARYMDPGQGRFLGMDKADGRAIDPASLHKYMYANNFPSVATDPSGLMTLMELSFSDAFNLVRSNVGAAGARQMIKRVITETLLSPRAALRELRICIRTPRKCNLMVPIIATGWPLGETAQHIRNAQFGSEPSADSSVAYIGSSNTMASPMVLNYMRPGHNRDTWLPMARAQGRCGRHPLESIPAATACDEYPFASTRQGGSGNWAGGNGTVSLQLTNRVESEGQMRLLQRFYQRCIRQPMNGAGLSNHAGSGPGFLNRKSVFISIGMPEAVSFFTCGR